MARGERGQPQRLPIIKALGLLAGFATVALLVAYLFPHVTRDELIGFLALVAGLTAIVTLQARRPVVQYLYYCRFPIAFGVLLLMLPALPLRLAPTLFRNMFEIGFADIVSVTTLAVLASWTVMIGGGLTAGLAHLRFGVEEWPTPPWLAALLDRWRFVLFSLLAVPTIATVCALSPEAWWWRIIAVLCGEALALLTFAAAVVLSEWLSPPDCLTWNVVPSHRWARLDRLHQARVPWVSKLRSRIERWLAAHGEGISAGYLDKEKRSLLPGHVFALSLLTTTLIVYAIGYVALRPPRPLLDAPALAYLLLLLILFGWLLSAIAFFFDRFNLPAVVVVAALPLLLYFISDIDHYYALMPPAAAPAPQPAGSAHGEVKITGGAEESARQEMEEQETGEIRRAVRQRVARWRERHPQPEPFIVVVAASGGGISASLWTAQVLAGLQEEFGDEFADALHVMSAVSGGSVGTMYYVSAFTEGRPPSDLAAVRQQAGRSSLAAMAWGLTYPDLWRLLSFSLDRYRDRGWAMEEAWKDTLGNNPTLAEWRTDVLQGRRPAVLFNATIAETGERYVLSSLALNPRPDNCGETSTACADTLAALTLPGLYQGADLRVTTAARLSATFPFVSPIARAWRMDDQNCTGYHVADGGYYDNFGVLSLVEWLRHVMDIPDAPRRVLLIQIRASAPRQRVEARNRAGLAYATVGPVLTLLNVRNSAQITRNDLDIAMLQEIGRQRNPSFEVVSAVFPLVMDAPLSWDLSDTERTTIERHWAWCRDVAPVATETGGKRESLIHLGVDTVRTFLRRSAPPPPPNAHDRDVQRFCLDTAS